MISFINANRRDQIEIRDEGLREITLAEACFPTYQFPLYYNDNDGKDQVIPHKVLVHGNTNKVLYVGPEYTPIHNSDIARTIDRFCNVSGWTLNHCRTLDDKQFKFHLLDKGTTFDICGQEANPQIIISNSYDGSRAFKVFIGALIKVCSNGAILSKGVSMSRKHTGAIPEDFIGVLEKTWKENIPRVLEAVEKKQWQVEDLDRIEAIWKKLVKPYPTASNNAPNKFVQALNAQWQVEQARGYKGEFGLFMAATDIVTHQFQQLSPSYITQLQDDIPNVFFN